jgi:hypothetical protein
MSLEDKHLEHIAKLQAVTDSSWSSWNSPIGLIIFLNGLALFAILIRFVFLMK